jgi:hypothetical protein
MAKATVSGKGTTQALNSTKVALNIDELKDFLRHIIENNRFIQSKYGDIPVAVDVTGDSGIGKTSAIIQLAKEMGLPNFHKMNLSQLDDLGDLVGFPIRQFEVYRGHELEKIWINEFVVDAYITDGYKFTGESRTSYCPPHWISGLEGGGVLMLDDWNRADARFIQAVMELIDRQEYVSWKLPKDWHIILTSNPDDGDYLVTATDNAQTTRSIGVDLKFDIKCWGRWAETNHIDSRCINFLLMTPELINKKVNARSAVMFFKSILSIPNFEERLALIQMIGEGSVGPEFASLFTSFINNKLDKIISPEQILFNPNEEFVIQKLRETIITPGNKYRADIASTIATRIINYSIWYASTNDIKQPFVDRLASLLASDVFQNDIRYTIVKMIYAGNNKFRILTSNQKIVKYITA